MRGTQVRGGFSRRHWGRDLLGGVRYPLRMFEGKSGKLSQFRVILFMFACAFVVNWPGEWTNAARDALAIIVFGLPVGDLFALIPAAEALGAVQAFFGKVTGRNAAAAARAFEPHEWAHGKPGDGVL